MKLFGWCRDKYRFMGIRAVRRKRVGNGVLFLFLCLIPVLYISSKIIYIQNKFARNKNFNTKHIDDDIRNAVRGLSVVHAGPSDKSVVILASEIYDVGGHTECIKNIILSWPNDWKTAIFLTRLTASQHYAAHNFDFLSQRAHVSGIDFKDMFLYKRKLYSAYKQIIAMCPRIVLAFTHPDDIFGAMLLCMLQKSGIKILFYNHMSHGATLGMSFADLILEGTATTAEITRVQRGFNNTAVVGLPYLPLRCLPKFSDDDISRMRQKLGAGPDNILTISGADVYKFFDMDNNTSPYFEMIRTLLERNPNMRHVMLTDKLNITQQNILHHIFAETDVGQRLHIIPRTLDYKIIFKCADVFIDSFPVSSALTQIDLISLGVANVIKINRENPMWTFHEYMPENYPFAFDNVPDMINGIEKLMYDEKLRHEIAESNYQFFIDNYEGTKWCKKLLGLMNDK